MYVVHTCPFKNKNISFQVSSSEYFSVSFELGEDSSLIHGREEFLPATKGTSLA